MEGLGMKKQISFKEGKLIIELGAQFDGDTDGVVAAEAGAYVKVDAIEAIKEIVKAQHQPTLEALLPWAKQIIGLVPEVKA